jgi:translation initiation factor 4A
MSKVNRFKLTNEEEVEHETNIIEETYDEINSWDDLDIKPELLRGIYSHGFEYPSPIQKKAIKPIINGRDVIAQAQSGTGKTATFAIGALQLIDITNDNTQVLILSPTRELAMQSCKVIEQLGNMMTDLRVQAQYGGVVNNDTSIFNSKNNPHIMCGCTGRIYDLIKRSRLCTKNIKLVIIDEADEMLSYGFKEQVYNIFQYIQENVQVILISATLPENIYPIINNIMRNPIKITVRSEMLTLEGISQYYIPVDSDRQKYITLKDIFSFISLSQCIIYCNSIKRVTDLYDAMKEDDFPVSCIHSNMDKQTRDRSFMDFKNGKSRVLISSNVTARGIDIQQVSVVINFDVPKSISTYLHRIGRSGRWGRKGVGINFITKGDAHKIREIEDYYVCQIKEMPNDPSIFKF